MKTQEKTNIMKKQTQCIVVVHKTMCHYCTYATQSYQEWNCIHQTNFTRTRQTKTTKHISLYLESRFTLLKCKIHIQREKYWYIAVFYHKKKLAFTVFPCELSIVHRKCWTTKKIQEKKNKKKYFCSLFIMLKVITVKNYKTTYYKYIFSS